MEGDKLMKKVYCKYRIVVLRAMVLMLCISILSGMFLTSCNGDDQAPDESQAAGHDTEYKTVEVLRLKEDIARGTKLTSAKFEAVTVSTSEAWIGSVTNKDDAIGKYALRDMSAGEYLVDIYISDEKPSEKPAKVVLDNHNFGFDDLGFIVVTEFLTPNTGEDLCGEIQKLIDKNPNKVIYFPDGEYIISSPIKTPSAGSVSVSLKLSDNAVIKASDDWDKTNGAMIRLGGKTQENNISIAGSNYYLEGGIIDGNGRADGVAVDHGRETSVRDVTIVNTTVGLHVKHGANSGSSDADIENIRIYGNAVPSSIGLLIEGWDNTFSNMRIANVQIGVKVTTAANLIRDIQCTYISSGRLNPIYASSYGFYDVGSRNWYDNCSSVDFSVGFMMESGSSKLISCVARWTDAQKDCERQVALRSSSTWRSIARDFVAEFSAPKVNCEYLEANTGGKGRIYDPIFNVASVNGDAYKSYLHGNVMWND